jgi:hypothetical protein
MTRSKHDQELRCGPTWQRRAWSRSAQTLVAAMKKLPSCVIIWSWRKLLGREDRNIEHCILRSGWNHWGIVSRQIPDGLLFNQGFISSGISGRFVLAFCVFRLRGQSLDVAAAASGIHEIAGRRLRLPSLHVAGLFRFQQYSIRLSLPAWILWGCFQHDQILEDEPQPCGEPTS